MKKYIIAILAVLILLTACDDNARTGTVTIKVCDEKESRTVTPSKEDTKIAKYVVHGLCNTQVFNSDFTSSEFTLSLDEGDWCIYIEAYSSDDKLIAKSDSQTVSVIRYKNTSATFQLLPIFDGTGTFNFKLGIPKDATAMNKILCSLTSADGTLSEVDFEFDFSADATIDGDYSIFTETMDISAGSYNLKVETTNVFDDVYGIPINDSVIIQSEQKTTYEHIWDMTFFPEDEVTLLVWKYYLGYLYVLPSVDSASVYLSLDGGNYTDITSDLDSNKYTVDEKTYSSFSFYASADASKWTRGGRIYNYTSFKYGPTGGYVFYDKGNYDDGWRFLEAAPDDLSDTYPFGYYDPNRTATSTTNQKVGTEYAIGTGVANTKALVDAMGDVTYTNYSGLEVGVYAAKACDDYSLTVENTVYDNWFLPSKGELNSMYSNLYKSEIGSFISSGYYWSSTEGSSDYYAEQVYFTSESRDYSYHARSEKEYVRPIRAF